MHALGIYIIGYVSLVGPVQKQSGAFSLVKGLLAPQNVVRFLNPLYVQSQLENLSRCVCCGAWKCSSSCRSLKKEKNGNLLLEVATHHLHIESDVT